MAYSQDNQSNVIPFPAPPRERDKDHLIQEIADILGSAESRAEPGPEERLASRLEHLVTRLEQIVQSAHA